MPSRCSTFLMFGGQAKEAMNWYVSIFKGSEISAVEHFGPGEQGAEGSIKQAHFSIAGHELICFDSPVQHGFTFTPAISLFVECESEEELDAAYEQLSAGGTELMPLNNYGFSRKFGWLNDRFGVSWQLNLT